MFIDAVYLVKVRFDAYESTEIALAGTLEGAKKAAERWYQDNREVEVKFEWWQPQADVWSADSGLTVILVIERWMLYEAIQRHV